MRDDDLRSHSVCLEYLLWGPAHVVPRHHAHSTQAAVLTQPGLSSKEARAACKLLPHSHRP